MYGDVSVGSSDIASYGDYSDGAGTYDDDDDDDDDDCGVGCDCK
jgi:hypothetical protein